MVEPASWKRRSKSNTSSTNRYDNLQSVRRSAHISPVAGSSVNVSNFSDNDYVGSFATHLVLEEGVLNIIRHFGHGQNVTLGFPVPLGADTIAQHSAFIPNQLEGARRKLVQSGAGVGLGHLLEQLFPLSLLAVTLECIVAILR